MREITVTIRLNTGEHHLIKSTAALIGLTIADYMRMETLTAINAKMAPMKPTLLGETEE